MDEFLKILARQVHCCQQMEMLLAAQREALKQTEDSETVRRLAGRIELLTGELGAAQQAQREFLKAQGDKELMEFLRTGTQAERKRAAALLTELQRMIRRLRKLGAQNKEIAAMGLRYVQFNMNVLSQVSAAPSYGATGEDARLAAGRTMFDSNV